MLNEIVIENLTVSYGDKTALHHVSTRFKKGNLYALIGHNGAGKTTLIKEILKGNRKKQDHIQYLSAENEAIVEKNLKYRMSFSPEKPVLFEELTAFEYVAFVLKMYRSYDGESMQRAERLFKLFNLEKEKNKFIFALSNGMKKKVCHIAALSLNSDFIFLDEPFAALDPVSIYELKSYLVKHFHDATFVLSTHQLDIIDNLSIDSHYLHIRMLNKGHLVFNGTKQELMASHSYQTIEEAYLHYHALS